MSKPNVPHVWNYKSVSADTAIKTGPGMVWKVICTASASGVIKVWDNTAASGNVILDSYTIFPCDEVELMAEYSTGLYLDVVSGTATVTVLYI